MTPVSNQPDLLGNEDLLRFDKGARLYQEKCLRCHGSLENSTKRNRSAERILWAQNNMVVMRSLNLDELESQEIAFALNNQRSQILSITNDNAPVDRELAQDEETQTPPDQNETETENPVEDLIETDDEEEIADLIEENTQKEDVPDVAPPEQEQTAPNYQLGKRKIRLLTAEELINTLNQVLGESTSENSSTLEGQSSGDGLKFDGTLLSLYQSKIEEKIDWYLSSQLQSEFPCIDQPNHSCTQNIIKVIQERAYRRPASAEETQKILQLNTKLTGELQNDLNSALALTFKALFLSPQFLYRTELGQKNQDGIYELTPYEQASYISYTLSGASPDRELYQLAKEGRLSKGEIQDQVSRIMRSKVAKKWIVDFFKSWLDITIVNRFREAPENFPKFQNHDQARSMDAEFTAFVEQLAIDQDMSLTELLTTPTTFVNRETASLYGTTSESQGMEMISTDPKQRAGILTLASVMSAHASSGKREEDKPIFRGLVIKESLLCEEVSLPSGLSLADVITDVEKEFPDFESLTVRDQYEVVMQQGPACIACHSTFMPYGYGFSNFNAIGEFKTIQKNQTIRSDFDISVDGQNRSFKNIIDFLPTLVNHSRLKPCFSSKLSGFVTRNANESSPEQLGNLHYYYFRKSGYRVKSFFKTLLSSDEIFLRKETP
ncbi:MAG: DUF1592 domain-containing protein [Pseudomonadota bacterium]